MRNGTFDRLVSELRRESARRQAIVAECLAPGYFAAHPQGYHLWLRLGADANTRQLCEALRQLGMVAVPGEAFSAQRDGVRPSLRISIGGGLADERLRRGLLLLSALTSESRQRKISIV